MNYLGDRQLSKELVEEAEDKILTNKEVCR
jgi:hypothetical protein